jgi:hypothetical protein
MEFLQKVRHFKLFIIARISNFCVLFVSQSIAIKVIQTCFLVRLTWFQIGVLARAEYLSELLEESLFILIFFDFNCILIANDCHH